MQSWAAYRRERGSLNPMIRADRNTALLAKLYVDAHRKRSSQPVSLYDFTPHEQDPAKTEVLTPENAVRLFG